MDNMICYDLSGVQIKCFYQWDLGQTIIIRGIDVDENTLFHFSSPNLNCAIVVEPSVIEGSYYVDVPNKILENSGYFVIYAAYKDKSVESGALYKTKYSTRITVKKKKMPLDYTPVENVKSVDIVRSANGFYLKQ